MNIKHYEEIVEEFKLHHPYMADEIADWRPRGDMGVRIKMTNGKVYDFHGPSKIIRNVETRPMHYDDAFDEEDWRRIFADRLCEYMCTKGITQQSLSEYTGISKGAINKYVNGKATPSAYVLSKLARAFDCTIMDLTD